MKNAGFTKQERTFIALMRVWSALFLGAAALFALSPDYLPEYLTNLGSGLLGWHSAPFPPIGDSFWVVLSVAFMLTLSFQCFLIQANLLRNIGYAQSVILAKFASCIGFAVCFFLYEKHFVYLVGGIVDGLMGIITWRLYSRAQSSRS